MSVLLLGFLFVVIMPLAEGVLLALVLREIHIRHPLPLGGVIATSQMYARRKARIADSVEVEETLTESALDGIENKNENINPETAIPPDSADEKNGTATPSQISVFDGAENIPENLPVNDALNAMMAESSAIIPNDLEHRIEESAFGTEDNITPEVNNTGDDMDPDDLEALAAALPGTKIDFSQELEADSSTSDAISPMAKELLGENFNFDALEAKSVKFLIPAQDTGEGNTKNSQNVSANTDLTEVTEAAEITLDVQEDDTGIIQVLSPFIFNTSPQLADFTVPQTILSMFSNDWIQETGSMNESTEEDASKFCFVEESRPMFVRKTKIN